jgi:opacity protein-like surface antigen
MKKSVCVLAVLAAAVSTSAVAKDLKQNKQAVSATQMTNSEMDKVTAGNNGTNGGGTGFGDGHGNNLGRGADRNNFHARF